MEPRKVTPRDGSAVLLGIILGVVFCRVAAMRASGGEIDWPKTFDSLKNLTQAGGVIVAGVWTYTLFVRQRLGRARANLEHSIVTVSLSDGSVLIRAVLEIHNTGSVVIRPPRGDIAISIVVPEPPSAVFGRDVTGDRNWPVLRRIEYDFTSDGLKLEPGEKERYPFDFVVPAGTKTIQLHSNVRCGEPDLPKQKWDETTVHNLEERVPSPAATMLARTADGAIGSRAMLRVR